MKKKKENSYCKYMALTTKVIYIYILVNSKYILTKCLYFYAVYSREEK